MEAVYAGRLAEAQPHLFSFEVRDRPFVQVLVFRDEDGDVQGRIRFGLAETWQRLRLAPPPEPPEH